MTRDLSTQRLNVSIIMAVFDEEIEIFETAVNSLIGDNLDIGVEIVIGLDNYSSKVPELHGYLVSLSKKHESLVKFFCNEENLGLANTLNKAFEMSSGQYIARMDADDISIKDRIIKQYKYLVNNNCDFIFCDALFFHSTNGPLVTKRFEYHKISDKYLNPSLISFDYAYHTSWFLKREIFDSIGYYRDLEVSQDYDFLLRVIKKNYKIGFLREPLVKIRIRNGSITNSRSYKQFVVTSTLHKYYALDYLFSENKFNELIAALKSVKPKDELAVNKIMEIVKSKNMSFLSRFKTILLTITKHPKTISFMLFKLKLKIKFHYFVFMSRLDLREDNE